MASKSNFISAFRQAVATMQDEYNKALQLADLADTLEWDATALAGEFSGSDITVTEFFTAKATIQGIETANAGIAGSLAKLRA